MPRQKVRILVVDDEPAIRQSLNRILQAEGYRARTEADGRNIRNVVRDFQPDLAVVDVRLPVGPDGYAVARALRGESDLPILFLTAADRLEDKEAGLETGDDYLLKPYAVRELLARIRALLRRSGRLQPDRWEVGDLVIDTGSRTVRHGGRSVELTRTEFELLATLARHPGQVLSKGQLLVRVWGSDTYDTNLVEVHMSALRRKLKAVGSARVETVYGAGYVLR